MEPSNKLLSDIVHFRSYAKYDESKGRREIYDETCDRNMFMHIKKFPELATEIKYAYDYVRTRKVMPSMRSMQFGGESIIRNNVRMFNCSFGNIDTYKSFVEGLYVLLCGSGYGYSVQYRHVEKLPVIKKPIEDALFIIPDSIEGWTEALNLLLKAYFEMSFRPIFDYSKIRPEGAKLSSGAKAPGPAKLKVMLETVDEILKKCIGRKLETIECHDLMCIISDCVVSGGVRKSACISVFSKNDDKMLKAKHGEWWVEHPHRARANNSVLLLRGETTREEFDKVYTSCIDSFAGEPGIIWTNDLDMGNNPCCEIGLNSMQFCNLTSIVTTDIKTEEDFIERCRIASFIGTLQASYTDFPYLNPKWKETTEKEALLGVSMTGIADTSLKFTPELLKKGAEATVEENKRVAELIGINPSYRITCIKPEGSLSCIVGSSSGIHSRYAKMYLRRVRMVKTNPLAIYLSKAVPELVEDDAFKDTEIVVTIPQRSPDSSITRSGETAMELFDRIIFFNKHWVFNGHIEGVNKHNVSATIEYKQEDIELLREAMWNNRDYYTGISLLPYAGGCYTQAPFEECDEETFNKYNAFCKNIDLKEIIEMEDNTTRQDTVACAGGVCEWNV